VNIPPRVQISHLGTRGEVKNGHHFFKRVFEPMGSIDDYSTMMSIIRSALSALLKIITEALVL
jgi:hypothetical protein